MHKGNMQGRYFASLLSILIVPLFYINASYAQEIDGIPIDNQPTNSDEPRPPRVRIMAPELPEWRDTTPVEYFAYVSALRISRTVIEYHLGHPLSEHDLKALNEANNDLNYADRRENEYLANLCKDVEVNEYVISDRDLLIFGDNFNRTELLIEEDVFSIFENTLSNLSEEAAVALIKVRESVSVSSNGIDWLKYASLAPEKMKKEVIGICTNLLNKLNN